MLRLRGSKLNALTLVLLLCFAVVSVVGCGGDQSKTNGDQTKTNGNQKSTGDDVIRIGLLYPLTGSLAKLGQEEQKGALLAAELRNAKGGINGKKIEWVIGDAPDPQAAVTETERLITVEKVDIIQGSYSSGVAYAASAVAEKHKKIYWECGGVADNITQRGFKYLFRFGQTGTSNGETAIKLVEDIVAKELNKDVKSLKIGIIHEDSAFGTSVADGAEKYAKAQGLNVVIREGYSMNTKDLSSLILKLKKANVDILVPTTYVADGLLLFKQMKELNYNPLAVVMGGNAIQDFKLAMGDEVNGLMHADITMPRTNYDYCPGLEEFNKEWMKKYNQEPYCAHPIRTFAGANVLFDVIEQAGSTDPDKIAEVARSLDLPYGSTATGWGVKFAPEGDPMMGTNLRAQAFGCIWHDGNIETLWPEEAAWPGVKTKLPWVR
jgi:branched-chain amino acid transport system substrate-binding protein